MTDVDNSLLSLSLFLSLSLSFSLSLFLSLFVQSIYSRCVHLSEGAHGSRLNFNIQRGYAHISRLFYL